MPVVLPQPAKPWPGAVPMLCIQVIMPSSLERGRPCLVSVATKYAPLPPGPFSMYSGDDHTPPPKVDVNVSSATLAAIAFVSVG